MKIGRAPHCDLCLSDPEVASTHAVIEQNGQGLRIHDLGSMGKLLVNNHAVHESSLKHGDVVELGHTRMLVQAVVEAEVRAAFDYPMNLARHRRAGLALLAAGLAAVLVWWTVPDRERAERARTARAEPAMVRIAAVSPVVATVASPEVADPPTAEAGAAPAVIGEMLAPPADAGAIGLSVVEPSALEPVPGNREAQPDPYAMAKAMVDEKVQGMMMEAHLLAAGKRLREADELLGSILHIAPDYADAYVERAWLCEDRGMLEPAIAQWREVIRLGGDTTRVAAAQDRLVSLEQARQEVQPKFGRRIRVLSTDHAKFPESPGVREMRMVTVHLAPADSAYTPNAAAVRVDVRFYDRDLSTGSIAQTRATGESKDLKVSDPWQQGETKTVTASYVVPAALAPAGTRAAQYYGYVVCVYHFGALQDASAQPSGLLAHAGLPGGASARSMAEAEVSAFNRLTP